MLFVDYSLEAGNKATLMAASARFLGATDGISPYKLKRASDHYNPQPPPQPSVITADAWNI